jgi:hypothetical protein
MYDELSPDDDEPQSILEIVFRKQSFRTEANSDFVVALPWIVAEIMFSLVL